jgi:hypothetical protein
MPRLRTRHSPRPGEIWLSRPPYLLLARIVDVDHAAEPEVVRYELHDDEGFLLEEAHASLDEGWWHAFQPLTRHYG